jgi:hypothetical protein
MSALRIALPTLCCSLSACGFLFSPAGGATTDADAGVGSEIFVTARIGAGLDFTSPHDWVLARRGDLINRQVFTVSPGDNNFRLGELVNGSDGCSGKFIPESRSAAQQTTMTLDNVSGTCAAGEVLTGNDSGATATVMARTQTGTIEIGILADDSVYTDPLVIGASTTDAGHYMSLTVAPEHRHKGIAGNGPRFEPSIDSHAIDVRADFTRLEYLEVTDWTNGNPGGYDAINVRAKSVTIAAALIYEDGAPRDGSANSNGISLELANTDLSVINSIVYDVGRNAISLLNVDGGRLNIANCTLYNCAAGNNSNSAGCVDSTNTTNGQISLANTIGLLAGTSMGEAFQVDSGSDFVDSSSNLSNDSSASSVGDNGIDGQMAGDVFFSTQGNVDLHILGDSMAVNAGDNLSFSFALDVDDDARPATGAWDIGADEI